MATILNDIRQIEERLQFIQQIKEEEGELEKRLAELRDKQQQDVSDQFKEYCQEAVKILQTQGERNNLVVQQTDVPFALLFLGGCSGQRIAQIQYQGQLPGLGGFVVMANGISLLIDPGVATFDGLLKQDIHPQALDAVIVTHADWHNTRDLSLILRAASPASIRSRKSLKQQQHPRRKRLRLFADHSVLYGLSQDLETAIRYIENSPFFDKDDKGAKIAELKIQSGVMSYLSPGKVSSFDLFFRLDGNFQELTPEAEYQNMFSTFTITEQALQDLQGKIAPDCQVFLESIQGQTFPQEGELLDVLAKGLKRSLLKDERASILQETFASGIDLYTHPSYHQIGFEDQCIPALDFIVKNRSCPDIRCVYLADTAYHAALATSYARRGGAAKSIDILICNVQELEAKKHYKTLDWNGLLKLTDNFQQHDLLTDSSLVVLRDWGLETVTQIDEVNGALVAAPEKLAVYQKHYQQKTNVKHVLIPGITWVKASHTQPFEFECIHQIEPFFLTGDRQKFGEIYYCSAAMQDVVRQAWAAMSDAAEHVLITGETGTGKDELAKAIHQEAGQKRKGIPISINAGVEHFDRELRGCKGGVFTDVKEDQKGWLDETKGGTLIIDEIGDMTEENQVKMLTMLQEHCYSPVGSTKKLPLTSQLIFTTDQDIRRMRNQLVNRMQRRIHIPPLRERPEDIPAILDGWRKNIHIPIFNEAQLVMLQQYEWPGNVRELWYVVKRLAETLPGLAAQVKAELRKKKQMPLFEETMNRKFQMQLEDMISQLHRAPEVRTTPQPDNATLFEERTEEEKQILSLLAKGESMSLQEIGEQANNTPKGTMLKRVNQLKRLGFIMSVGKGPSTKYRLVSQGKAQ